MLERGVKEEKLLVELQDESASSKPIKVELRLHNLLNLKSKISLSLLFTGQIPSKSKTAEVSRAAITQCLNLAQSSKYAQIEQNLKTYCIVS